MKKLSIEYQNARKSYKASKAIDQSANEKENKVNQTERSATDQDASKPMLPICSSQKAGMHSSFNPKQKPSKQSRQHLPTDYNTAKLKFKASKSRAKSASTKERPNEAKQTDYPTRPSTSAKQIKVPSSSIPETNDNLNKLTQMQTPHTAESGLKMLGLLRPIDNKTYEFGLAHGIEVHLVESIKLCGLRKGREKSIIDMVTTLCNHLTNREDEINRWIEFADRTALAATEKLERSMMEYNAVCESKGVAERAVHDAREALIDIHKEVLMLKQEFDLAKDSVSKILSCFPPVMSDLEDQLRKQSNAHSDNVKSECKSEVCDVIDDLTREHDTKTQRLETEIGSLEMSLHSEKDKVAALQSQLDNAESDFDEERADQLKVQEEIKNDFDKTQIELSKANEKIKSLEQLVEDETVQKKKELEDMEEKMKAEIDVIDDKVKQSFKALVEKKNKEVERAQKRAQVAEASAKAAERLLRDLKASVVPNISVAKSREM